MDWPKVGICIPSFNRASVVTRTVDLLHANLKYAGVVQVFVGCDGDDDSPHRLQRCGAMVLDTPSGGIGANVNRLVDEAHRWGADITLTMDDDHHLVAPLNIDRHVAKLMDDAGAGRIHLLMEAVGDEHFAPYKFVAHLDRDHYWCVHWDSPEHFIMSFRPSLSHRRWWEVMGPLPERLRTGETEGRYALHCKQQGLNGAGVDVLVPLTAPGRETWVHNAAPFSWNQRGF